MSIQDIIIPPSLKPSDTIGIMAPSTVVSKDKLEQASSILSNKGYNVFIHPQCYEQVGSSAGTPEQKAQALHDLIQNPDINMILAAAGGNHCGLFLEHIDFELIKSNPKIICGYSDVTAMLCSVHHKSSLVTYHGPTASHLIRDKYTSDQFDQLLELLSGSAQSIDISKSSFTVRQGTTSGKLLGGNLSLISSLIGTPYAPNFKDSILFIEDCADQLSRYARMLTQIYNAGIFNEISGLIIGDMSAEEDTGSVPFGSSIKDIVMQLTHSTGYPVIINAPFGHAQDLITFPVGQSIELTASEQSMQIKLL